MKRLTVVLIRLLIRCYPRAWRRRYGEEFLAMIEQMLPTPTGIADMLRGALDAHHRYGALSLLDMQPLPADERRFWRRWVLALCLAGAIGGLIFRLTDITIILVAPASGIGDFMWGRLFALPFLYTLSLALGIAQRRLLRAIIIPTIGVWWVWMLVLGPTIALAIMTTDHSYTLLPDLFSMTNFLFSQLSLASLPMRQQSITSDRLVLTSILPVLLYFGIGAAFQAYALKGHLARSGWWIVIVLLAALAGLGALRLTTPVHLTPYPLVPTIVRPDILIIDSIITIAQFGLACAAYAIVSGAGLLLLRRLPEMPQAAPRGAHPERS